MFNRFFLPIIVIRGILRWLQGEPADLLWTVGAQAARNSRHRSSNSAPPEQRNWYPRD